MKSIKRAPESSKNENRDVSKKVKTLHDSGGKIVKNTTTEMEEIRKIRQVKYLASLNPSSKLTAVLGATTRVNIINQRQQAVLPTVEEFLSTCQVSHVEISRLADIKNEQRNIRELRSAVVIGRCVTKTTFNTEQRKWWMKNNYRLTEFFRAEVIDEYNVKSEVRFNVFNENATRLFNKLEIGGVFAIKNFAIVNSNKVYNALPNDYECSLVPSSQITQLHDDGRFPPEFLFSFTPIGNILKISESSCIDLEGIVLDFTSKRLEKNWKTGETYMCMEIELMDKSGYSIRLKLTEQYCERFESKQFDVYRVHNVKVTTFGSPNEPVPQRRLVRIMRCSHHDTDSINDTVGTINDDDIFDFDDDDDPDYVPDENDLNDNSYDDGEQIFQDKTENDKTDDGESLLDWFQRVGQFLNPTPLKLLKYAERTIAKYELARKYALEFEKKNGKYSSQKYGAEMAGVHEGSFSVYMKRFKDPTVFTPRKWCCDDVVNMLQKKIQANGGVEKHGDRSAVAKELGMPKPAVTHILKAIDFPQRVSKNVDKRDLPFHRAEMIRLDMKNVSAYCQFANTPGQEQLSRFLKTNPIPDQLTSGVNSKAGAKSAFAFLGFHQQEMERLKVGQREYCRDYNPGISLAQLTRHLRRAKETDAKNLRFKKRQDGDDDRNGDVNNDEVDVMKTSTKAPLKNKHAAYKKSKMSESDDDKAFVKSTKKGSKSDEDFVIDVSLNKKNVYGKTAGDRERRNRKQVKYVFDDDEEVSEFSD